MEDGAKIESIIPDIGATVVFQTGGDAALLRAMLPGSLTLKIFTTAL